MNNIKILKNYILYFLLMLLVCIVGISNVFADTYENIGYLDNYATVTIEPEYTTTALPLTRLNEYYLGDVLALNVLVDNYTFSAGVSYSIELFFFKGELQNADRLEVQGITSNNQLVTCNSIGIDNSNPSYPNFKFNCSSNVNSLQVRISNSTNSYVMDDTYFQWNYAYLRRITSSTDTSVLESQNAQIIQGQQDIINNQNQNTDKEIESQKVCDFIDKSNIELDNRFLGSNGILNSSNASGITNYIKVFDNSDIYLLTKDSNHYGASLCFYDTNKSLLQCSLINDLSVGKLTLPTNTSYIRISINKISNQPTLKICKNGNQAVSDSVNNLNDSLNDDDSSGATSEASEFFSSFTTNTFGLTSIITAPLNLIQSLTSSTCSELHLPLPYLNNKYLDLPCMTSIYQTHFGSFFTMYQTITYGIIAYWVCVRIFNQVKDFKNPEHDEIEVVDL